VTNRIAGLMKKDLTRLILAADLAGTFVFAVEGALAAIQGQLDFLGVLVLSCVSALGGGVIRDLLIAASPPQAVRDWRYAAVASIAGVLTFFSYPVILQFPDGLIIILDAAGLALFAVAGTEKALAYGIHPLIAILMGTLTGVGGGAIRDLLLTRVPTVLSVDIYASAALAGSALMVIGRRFGLPPAATAVAGGLFCFALRLVSVALHWHLPVAATAG
jgi:uncharacterized membrane protein YeiH